MIPIKDSVPCSRKPIVLVGLISANTVIFALEWMLPPEAANAAIASFALIPLRYSDPRWAMGVGLDPADYLPFLTNTFMHGGWLHLIFNMWTLWIFGCALEDRLGHLRFGVFYVLCGLAASLTHFFFNTESQLPALGASGAIAGVIGAYAALFPTARVTILVPILIFPLFFDVPALVFAAFWFAIQVLQGTHELFLPSLAGGIAWWAHIGGFLAGILLLVLLRGFTPGSGNPWGWR